MAMLASAGPARTSGTANDTPRCVGFNWHKLSQVKVPWSNELVLFSEARHYDVRYIVRYTVRAIQKTW
jgi:hypothetical protein